MATETRAALEILRRLTSTEPPVWLAPNPSLSEEARTGSVHLFSSLKPFCPKSPFEQLLVEGFDSEQIWQQIDVQAQPSLSSLRRELRRYEKNQDEISRLFGGNKKAVEGEKKASEKEVAGGSKSEDFDDLDDMEMDGFDEDDDEDEEEMEDGRRIAGTEDGEESGSEEDESDDEEDEEGDGKGGGGIEDGFLKIKELEEYLEEDEAREYGLKDTDKGRKKEKKSKREDLDEISEDEVEEMENDDEDEEDGNEDEDEDEEDEIGAFGVADEDDEDEDKLARYEDFFGSKKKKDSKRKPKLVDESEDVNTDSEDDDNDGAAVKKKKSNLSTHERELLELKSKIEQLEKANLEPKAWTMQGEVTAATRPKNSALEVDLDFEHNARPAPVITEEVTASLEELIRKRILEGHFDDVQKPPSLPTKAPREIKELDENKSKKGLAEIYEEEYAQKTNPVATTLSFTDEQKKEAGLLFKSLCLKLDALSHFNFAPKPVIEDMTIQANVPALAMEEIAPLAVSDAAMLAPEEVFSGKGDIKDDAELTQAERKRRRANKKRKYKAESARREAMKASGGVMVKRKEGDED